MAREKLNTFATAPNQIWKHIVTDINVIIERVEGDYAYCALMDEPKVGKLKVVIPVVKFMHWGNRGFAHVRTRKGKALKGSPVDAYGIYNPRKKNLGAL